MGRKYPYYGLCKQEVKGHRYLNGNVVVYFVNPKQGYVIYDNYPVSIYRFEPGDSYSGVESPFKVIKNKKEIKKLDKKRFLLQI